MSRSPIDTDTNVHQLRDHERIDAAAARLIEYIEEVQEHSNQTVRRHLRTV